MRIPGYTIDPVGAYRRGYAPQSMAEIRAQYWAERPECGDPGKLTTRLFWPEKCRNAAEDDLDCIVPYWVAVPSPGGCELEDAVAEGLEDRGL
jgi:hypothetical protein